MRERRFTRKLWVTSVMDLTPIDRQRLVSGLPTIGPYGLSGESYSSCGCLGRSFSAGRLARTVMLDVGIHDIERHQVKLGGLNTPVCSYLVDAICAI